MARRKIREQKSKFQGTKQVLKDVNTVAHDELHKNPTPGSPTISSFAAQYKWGTKT